MNTPAIRRMPTYLHKLLKMRLEGKVNVSSTELAEYMNIELIVVRKVIIVCNLRKLGEPLLRYLSVYFVLKLFSISAIPIRYHSVFTFDPASVTPSSHLVVPP